MYYYDFFYKPFQSLVYMHSKSKHLTIISIKLISYMMVVYINIYIFNSQNYGSYYILIKLIPLTMTARLWIL